MHNLTMEAILSLIINLGQQQSLFLLVDVVTK